MAVYVTKTWETVYFEAQSDSDIEVIELNYNNKTKEIQLTTVNEEGVSFKGDTIEQAALKVEALNKAIEYLKGLK